MATEAAVLTALPYGRDHTGQLLVTCYVTPRLSADGPASAPLADFPAFANWPRALEQVRLHVEIEPFGVVDTFRLAEHDSAAVAPDPDVWATVFDPDAVRVVTREFQDLGDRVLRSFPADAVAASVLNLYGTLAGNFPDEFPPATSGPLAELADLLGSLGDHGAAEWYPSLDGLLTRPRRGGKDTGRVVDTSGLSPTEYVRTAFIQAYRFYDRPGTRDPAGPDAVPDPPKPPEIDFHGYVALLGDYPVLLRRLGLAIDLVVRPGAEPPAGGRIRLHADAGPSLDFLAAEEARPWTHYRLDDRRFLPDPRDKEGELVDGVLRLDSPGHFDVQQIDVDGSALKTVDFAATVARLRDHIAGKPRSMERDAAAAPALRTGGFVVTRLGRAAHVLDQLDESSHHEQDHGHGTPAMLFAEDVTRGYRVEVHDVDRDAWHSLCRRTGSYVIRRGQGDVPLDIDPDEGYVKGASTTGVPGDDDELYLHEAAFGWNGWSLVAKLPGRPVVEDEVGEPDVDPPADLPLVTSFEPTPGTLPRLRFGTTYSFRARAVDLAGNSVPEDDTDPEHVSPPEPFRRFDPVPAPVWLPRRVHAEGESLHRLVIRSTLGITPAEYVALTRITGLAGHTDPDTAYLDRDERHVVPPKTAVQLAEWHGAFDDAFGLSRSQADRDVQFDIAAREAGTYTADLPGAIVVNPDPAGTPSDLSLHTRGAPLQPGEYIRYDTEDLPLPYLPDVLARGISFTVLPGDGDSRLLSWPGTWPDLRPVRLRIVDGGGSPHWDAASRLLTVSLPQAAMVTVRVSSHLAARDLPVLGIWMLLPERVRDSLDDLAVNGRHWMLTPYQEVTLVHAVEKPLAAPTIEVTDAGVTRNRGETFAVLTGQVANHAKSTGRIDIDAHWTEPVDDLARPGPDDITGQAQVADFSIEADEDMCTIGRDDVRPAGGKPAVHAVRHEFRDTKHRTVTYRATATTRFREYFPVEITGKPELITHQGPERDLVVPSSRQPDPPAIRYVVPTFTWHEEEAGPESTGRRTVRRTRKGNGLRVYLDRPWYSSGAGELLAVVLPDQPHLVWPIDVAGGITISEFTKAQAEESAQRLIVEGSLGRIFGSSRQSAAERLVATIRRFSSAGNEDPGAAAADALSAVQAGRLADLIGVVLAPLGDPAEFTSAWGSDPIWGSAAPAAGPYIHQFPLRSAVGTGLSLAEVPGARVAAVGHTPQYDPERQLWFCDLQLNAGRSYYPFVKLALARYQPTSIPGVHLSRVVVPPFAQLVADRTAALTSIATGRAQVTLRGPGGFSHVAQEVVGPVHGAGPSGLALSRFAVGQVERLPADAATDLAWQPVGDEVRLTAEAPSGLGDVRFSGTVTLPRRPRGERYRVTIREFEILGTDASQADATLTKRIGFGVFTVSADKPVRYRLVYADHLPV
jgi:hypothetical protein